MLPVHKLPAVPPFLANQTDPRGLLRGRFQFQLGEAELDLLAGRLRRQACQQRGTALFKLRLPFSPPIGHQLVFNPLTTVSLSMLGDTKSRNACWSVATTILISSISG